MNKNQTFCEICRKDVNYIVKEIPMTDTIRGQEISYVGKEARCPECGELVYVPDVMDFTVKALWEKYRKRNNIISIDKILEIPNKYSIGKHPLSLLLGWGELTFTRYCDGKVPSKPYSDILTRIYDDPVYFLSLLEANKTAISEICYNKSRKAVEAILKQSALQDKKIFLVAQYISNRGGTKYQLEIQKLLYFIQGFFYAFQGRFAFAEDCQAWKHGPVFREVYDRYDKIVEWVENFDSNIFTPEEKEIYDSVINNFGCYSGHILENITHKETPWRETRVGIEDNEYSTRIIPKQLIGQYFSGVKDAYKMETPKDILKYSSIMFDVVRRDM